MIKKRIEAEERDRLWRETRILEKAEARARAKERAEAIERNRLWVEAKEKHTKEEIWRTGRIIMSEKAKIDQLWAESKAKRLREKGY